MKKLLWKTVAVIAVISFGVSFFLTLGKPTFYGVEEVRYSEQYQSFGFIICLSDDELLEKELSGFNIAKVDDSGRVVLFRPVKEDILGNPPYEEMVVTCYSADGLTWVWDGEHSEKSFLLARFFHRFVGLFADLLTILVLILLCVDTIVRIGLLRVKPSIVARVRKIKRYRTHSGTVTDFYYVEGLSGNTILSKASVDIGSDEIDFRYDVVFSDMVPVCEVFVPSEGKTENPVEGQIVTALKRDEEWEFVCGDVPLRKMIRRKRCYLWQMLILNIIMMAFLLFISLM